MIQQNDLNRVQFNDLNRVQFNDLNRVEFKVYAAADADHGGLEYVEATSRRTVSPDVAKAIVAQFPRSVGLRAHRFIGRRGVRETGEVVFRAGLYQKKLNEGPNEGEVKRYRSFREHAERLGHEVHYDPGAFRGFPGVVPSEEDFEKRLVEHHR